jgi:hypothetical protein
VSPNTNTFISTIGNSIGSSIRRTISGTFGNSDDTPSGNTVTKSVSNSNNSMFNRIFGNTVTTTNTPSIDKTNNSIVTPSIRSHIPIYNSHSRNYKYIEDDQLSKMFGFCMNTENKTFKVYFALFSINQSCFIEGEYEETAYTSDIADNQSKYNTHYPFLQFHMETQTDIYSFPQMDYECPVINIPADSLQEGGEPDSDEKSQEQIHFETECIKYFLSMFSDDNIIHAQKMNISNLYKGFMEYDDTTVFVFFDISTVLHELKRELTIAILDEILYKKIVYSTPVDPVLTDFFKKNNELCNLKTLENQIYPFPFQLYLCNFTDEYENIRLDNPQKYLSFEHPFFGIAYYFSTSPIVNTDVSSLKRFSCFITNGLYIKGNLDDLEEDEKEKYRNQIITASSFYFHENLLQLWGIKNISHFIQY